MQDYLKKSVSNQRTGANIVGITLDNLNLMNFSDDFKTTFNIIEEFAKRTDEINLKHEKDAFRVELRKKQLEFSGKYSDHDIYTNDEKYNAMMKDYNNLKLEAEKEIANFKWATPQEKKILLEDYKNNFNEEYLKMYSKRQNAVLLKTVDKTQFLIESTKNNLKLMDLSNVGERNKEINKLSEYYDDLVGFNCMTEYEKAINLSSDIVEIEKDGIRKQLEENILFGTQYPTIEEKQKAIDDIKNSLLNEDRLNSTVENVIKTYKLDDQENVRIYMKTKLKNEYNNISNGLREKVSSLENKIIEKNNKKIEAYNKGDFSEYLEIEKGPMKWDDILFNETNAYRTDTKEKSFVYQITGKTISQINKEGEYIKNLVPSERLEIWRKDIKNLMDKGYSKFTATSLVMTPILSKCDDETAQAIINTMSVEDGEYTSREYSYILKGIKNPENKEFEKAKKINSLIEIGGKANNTQMSIAKQIPIINLIAEKIVEKSNGNISYNKALQTTISLALGINARDGVVPLTEVPENIKQQSDFLMHVFTDEDFQVVKTLQKEFDNENFIEIIADMKSDNNILLPVSFKKGDK